MRSLFYVAILLVDLGVHAYFWVRLFHDPGWSKRVRIGGAVAMLVLAVVLPLIRILAREAPGAALAPFELVIYSWMGACLFLFTTLGLFDLYKAISAARVLARSAMRGMESLPPPDPERRRMLATTAAAVAGVATTGLSAAALRGGLSEVELKELGVKLARIPKALDGLTLVQLTDVHIGMSTIDTRFVQQIVDTANRAKPDAVVITGDLVDGRVALLGPAAAHLAKLKARYGVYFVTGNHEYFSGADEWTEYLRKLGITVLRNSRATLGDAGAQLDLAGVEDFSGARWSDSGGGPNLDAALAGRDPERGLILLAHQPKAIHEAAAKGVELQISGHTHGGQIFPFSGIVGLTQPYLAGLHRHDENAQIYVSRGTGYWGPPMRLGAPAEITKIILSSS